ncbi:hypothetical protein PV325_011031, partial [Microctonus aethiopoides]
AISFGPSKVELQVQINTQVTAISHLKQKIQNLRVHNEQYIVLKGEKELLENKVKMLNAKVELFLTPGTEQFQFLLDKITQLQQRDETHELILQNLVRYSIRKKTRFWHCKSEKGKNDGHLGPVGYTQSTSEIYHEDEALIVGDDTMDIPWITCSQINIEPVTNWVDNYGKQLEHLQPSHMKQQPGALRMDEKSCGSTRKMSRPPLPPIPANAWDSATSTDSSWEIRKMARLNCMGPTYKKTIDRSSTDNVNWENIYELLNPELRPLPPDNTCQ